MKKLSVVCLWLLSFTMLIAQEKMESLVVKYQANVQMDLETILNNVPPQARAQVKPMLKAELDKGIILDYTLKTNGKQSIYQLDQKIDNSQTQAGIIVSQIKQADKEPTYKDLEKGIYKKEFEFPGFKKFLMGDSLGKTQWTVTREKSKILDFEVRKALGKRDSIDVVAWFAPKLAIKDGPVQFSGLPGLILKVEMEQNGAKFEITATEVSVREEEITINPPKGDFMTEAEIQKEIEQMVKQMKEMQGGGVDTE